MLFILRRVTNSLFYIWKALELFTLLHWESAGTNQLFGSVLPWEDGKYIGQHQHKRPIQTGIILWAKDLQGNPKPQVSPDQTEPDRNQSWIRKCFKNLWGLGIKISVLSGLGYFVPGYQIFLSKNFGENLGIKWKPCLAFINWVSTVIMVISML